MKRGFWSLVIIASFGALPSAAHSEDPPPPKNAAALPKNDAAFKRRVNQAIDWGLGWLRRQQRDDGMFGWGWPTSPRVEQGDGATRGGDSELGRSALALFTLRSCGVPEDDPDVVRGFQWLRKTYLALKDRGELRNYSVALTLLALEVHRVPPLAPGPDTDRYGRSLRPAPDIPPLDLEWMRELTAWLVAAQTGEGGFGYQSPGKGWHDHSNTQYSLLALKAARRCGIAVPPKVWEKALKHLLQVQETDGPWIVRKERLAEDVDGGGERYGSSTRTKTVARDRARGWGYGDGNPATGSMTSGGVSSLVICRSELLPRGNMNPRLDERATQAIWDGLAWLGLHFTVTENPGPKGAPMFREEMQYYYLYGLERAGVLAGVVLMGEHDWYFEGAAYLVDQQVSSGGWCHERPKERPLPPGVPPEVLASPTLLDTCFALLFLKRATFRVARGSVATAPGDEALDLTGAESLDDRAFRDLFDAVFEKYVAGDLTARSARTADFLRMGKRVIPLLILRLEDAEEGVRAAAIEVLLRTTGVSQGYDPKGPEEARSAAIRAWEDWWMAKGSKLTADVDAGRFREK